MTTTSASHNAQVDSQRRTQLIAALITLVIAALVVLTVAYMRLTYIPSSSVQTWPPVDSSEILFDGEYVMAGDVLEPEAEASEPAQEAAVEEPQSDGLDLTSQGEPQPAPTPPVSSERTSHMKVAPAKPEEKTGPSKAELEAQRAKEKAQQETQQKIAGQMKFGSNSSSGSGTGKTGSPDGNSTAGKVSGAPGYSLEGRTLAHWELPAKTAPNGTVSLRVVVNQQGKVIEATVKSSSGAAASEAVRSACIAAARKCQFSVKLDAPARQSGTLTYKFTTK